MSVVSQKEASRLSLITFISNFGDYLTLFSVIKVIYNVYGDPLAAGFGGVGIGSAAAVFAGFFIPSIKKRFNTKPLIIGSLLVSFFSVLSILLLEIGPALKTGTPYFVLLFVQVFSNKIFDAAKETHTHGFSNPNTSHQGIQAVLMSGFYRAQFLGPLAAFFLLKSFTVEVPVILDLITFLIAIFLSFGLSKGPTLSSELSILRPLKYLRQKKELFFIFLLRTFGFWIPASSFNMLIFENAITKFQVGVELSGLIYSVLGFGALIGTILVGRIIGVTHTNNLNRVAAIANIGFAFVAFLIYQSSTAFFGAFAYLAYGFCMGINSTSTQAMRRSHCDKNQLPEIIGLEAILGFTLQFALAFLHAKSAFGGLNVNFVIVSSYGIVGVLYFVGFRKTDNQPAINP